MKLRHYLTYQRAYEFGLVASFLIVVLVATVLVIMIDLTKRGQRIVAIRQQHSYWVCYCLRDGNQRFLTSPIARALMMSSGIRHKGTTKNNMAGLNIGRAP